MLDRVPAAGLGLLHLLAGVGCEWGVAAAAHAGANVDVLDAWGSTPLHWAAARGHEARPFAHLCPLAPPSRGSHSLFSPRNNALDAGPPPPAAAGNFRLVGGGGTGAGYGQVTKVTGMLTRLLEGERDRVVLLCRQWSPSCCASRHRRRCGRGRGRAPQRTWRRLPATGALPHGWPRPS